MTVKEAFNCVCVLQVWRHGGREEAEDATDGSTVQMWRRCFTGRTHNINNTTEINNNTACINEMMICVCVCVFRQWSGLGSCWTPCWRLMSDWAMMLRRRGPCWTNTGSLWTLLRWDISRLISHQMDRQCQNIDENKNKQLTCESPRCWMAV